MEETSSDFLTSRKAKGLADKTLQSYEQQFRVVARHLDVKTDIAMRQKADLDAMIISMCTALLSSNNINSYTRTLKMNISLTSWTLEDLLSPHGELQEETAWPKPRRSPKTNGI